jgi:hypothetical protein
MSHLETVNEAIEDMQSEVVIWTPSDINDQEWGCHDILALSR